MAMQFVADGNRRVGARQHQPAAADQRHPQRQFVGGIEQGGFDRALLVEYVGPGVAAADGRREFGRRQVHLAGRACRAGALLETQERCIHFRLRQVLGQRGMQFLQGALQQARVLHGLLFGQVACGRGRMDAGGRDGQQQGRGGREQ